MHHMRESVPDRIFNIVNIFIITIVLLLIMVPLLYILAASISDPDLVMTGKVFLIPRGITFEGYKRVFQDPEIVIGYRNTIFYTVFGTLISLVLTLSAAYALSKKRFIGRKIVMGFIVFTMFFGGGMIPTYILMKSLHLLNTYFILLICGAISSYNLIISRTFFMNGVPQEIEESAQIDGCSTIRTFVSIVLPLSKALIGVMALYYGVGQWNSFFSALIYLTDRNKVPLQLVLREILVSNQMNAAMLASKGGVREDVFTLQVKLASLLKYSVIVVSSIPVLVVYPFFQKYFNRGVMLGSLKG